MPTRPNSRAASNARNAILEMLKDDHKRLKKAYRDFTKVDMEEDPERGEMLVRQALADLTVHATLEEELLYPAARAAISEPDLIDEAEVEHESAHALIEQLKGMSADDEKFAARFTVLCEYVLHHVKEEEGELFPQLQAARLDWEAMLREMTERREELAPSDALDDGTALQADTDTDAASASDSEMAMPGGNGDGNMPARGKAGGGAKPRSGSASGNASQPGGSVTSRRN